MIRKFLYITILFSSLASSSFAANVDSDKKPSESATTDRDLNAGVQKVLDEYKAYVSTVPPVTREEIINYRKEIAKINREKRELYGKLSAQAQGYLAKEQEFKKKLPIKERKILSGALTNTDAGDSKNK